MSLFKNQKGIGLVGVLVAGGIASIIAYAVSQLLADMSRSQRSVLQTTEAGQLLTQINLLLADPVTCTRNFGPTSAGGPISLGGLTLNRDLVDSAGAVVYDTDSAVAYENNSILLRNFKYELVQTVSTSPYIVVGRLTFNLEKSNIADKISVGGKNLSRSLILSTTLTGAGGTLVSCSSAGSQTNQITMNCPAGQAVTGFSFGVPVCSIAVPDMACPAGQVMTGINAGAPVCIGSPTVVASSLGPNGYIQYSNGFTVQWGQFSFVTDITYTLSYSVPFSVVYSVVISGTNCPGGDCQDNAAAVRSIGLNSFTASTGRDGGGHDSWWIAYGSR